MKPVAFALSLNLAVLVIGGFLVQVIPVLGGIVCLFSYPTVLYLGYILAKYPVKISVHSTGAPIMQTNNGKRQSRIRAHDDR